MPRGKLFRDFTRFAHAPVAAAWAMLLFDNHPTMLDRIRMAEAWQGSLEGPLPSLTPTRRGRLRVSSRCGGLRAESVTIVHPVGSLERRPGRAGTRGRLRDGRGDRHRGSGRRPRRRRASPRRPRQRSFPTRSSPPPRSHTRAVTSPGASTRTTCTFVRRESVDASRARARRSAARPGRRHDGVRVADVDRDTS